MSGYRAGMALDYARAHGLFNIASGVWPLVHMSSFEAALGPKTDRWLVRTVAGLLIAAGAAQVTTESRRTARGLGLGVAGTLAAVDLTYAPPGRISRAYLVDAAAQAGWIAGWLRPTA